MVLGGCIYLAIKKDMEPSLLLPMGTGYSVNLPLRRANQVMPGWGDHWYIPDV